MALQDHLLVYVRYEPPRSLSRFLDIHKVRLMTNLLPLLTNANSSRGLDVLEKYSGETRKRAKQLQLYIGLCFGCVVTSTVIVIMEAFCLMALQFCDGEDLISLYWSTWTMIQVGSLIAMVGIILALVHSLQDRTHP